MQHFEEDHLPEVSSRRLARILAMQGLCQWEVQPEEPQARFDEWLSLQEAAPEVCAMAGKLVAAVWSDTPRWDSLITQTSTQWDVSRISPVERNILRVALAERLSGLTPPKVSIDEAIELGREFGGADSPRFINGILDDVLRRESGGGVNT